jgi:hypothetical protein
MGAEVREPVARAPGYSQDDEEGDHPHDYHG